MTLFSANSSVQAACTNVHRPLGGIEGLREVHDDVGRLSVSAFPFAMVRDMSMTRAAVPACYILADHCTAYIGESGNVGRRLTDHFRDQTKAFARATKRPGSTPLLLCIYSTASQRSPSRPAWSTS